VPPIYCLLTSWFPAKGEVGWPGKYKEIVIHSSTKYKQSIRHCFHELPWLSEGIYILPIDRKVYWEAKMYFGGKENYRGDCEDEDECAEQHEESRTRDVCALRGTINW
jgi:hypothetical protein